MAVRSGFFNSIGGDRIYDARFFAEYFATFIGNGVFPNPSTGLQVTAGQNLTTVVKPGKGWINGYYLVNDSDFILQHDIADGVLKRVDRVVMKLDFLTREINIYVKKGTFASNPVGPTLQRDLDAYELSLADVLINNGEIQISQARITDTRMNGNLCGIVSGVVNQVDTTTLYQQYETFWNSYRVQRSQDFEDLINNSQQAFNEQTNNNQNTFNQQSIDNQSTFDNQTMMNQEQFDAWFATVQDVLSDDVAGNLLTLIKNHESTKVSTVDGVHGLRYYDKKLWFEKENGEWEEYYSGNRIGVATVTDFVAIADNGKVTLTLSDPNDIEFEGALIAKWSGTKILRKVGSYPQNINDGVLVVNNGVRNQYKTNGFVDDGLTNGIEYFYAAFAYTENEVISEGAFTSAKPQAYVIYGVKIDTTNSNPETAVTYTNDAAGFIPARGNNGAFNFGSWEDKFPFNQIKPCLYKDGAVVGYLNPNNYGQFVEGTVADIASGNAGDVMVEIPTVWWNFEKIGTELFIRFANAQVDATYKPLGHTRGATVKEKMYIAAYLGFEQSGKLRSLSGKTPTVNKTIGAFRTLAKANGANYDQMAYYPLLMLQVLYLVMFKSRDSQTALGRGYVDGNSAARATGGANTRGLFYGETTGKQQDKFCGIEDFYGNLRCWIDGMFSDANRNILIGTQNFNDTGAGYDNFGQGATANISGYISDVQGGTETGFIIKAKDGSETTHYADYGTLNDSRLPHLGGSWSNASDAGAFNLYVNYSASSAYTNLGARLMAL